MKKISKKTKDFLCPTQIVGDYYRFTLLTPALIRIEYDINGSFNELNSQVVVNRNFPEVPCKIDDGDELLILESSAFYMHFRKGEFNWNNLVFTLKENCNLHGSRWRFGTPIDCMKGTARTLDGADGIVEMEDGLISKNGISYLDDSDSLMVDEDGYFHRRNEGSIDGYVFCYGRDYFALLKDFFRLTGPTPLLPRYALGNWWSRYWHYSQEEILILKDRFRTEELPFSVWVVDMDWHLTDVAPEYGGGWTGYSWNRKLIPEPEKMLSELHEAGLKVSLNLHPASGVRPYEDAYVVMAEELGEDPDSGRTIPFQASDGEFMKAYFKHLLHPLEQQGVDFWWIDWQQEDVSEIPGLDPLWVLNREHFIDMEKQGRKAIILSRYAGIGSHRYPVGFSGDSVISWASLDFQPYFTASASNVGYCWWSHDIGGHMKGDKDDELAVRWLQFGIFSPVCRLHSSSSPFNSKEPWCYGPEERRIMGEYLRFRYRLIPYIQTMNHLLAEEGLPVIRPLYYHHPWEEESYNFDNQYFFGSELMIRPITSKIISALKRSAETVWLPQGRWFDFFTGRSYHGGGVIELYRPLDRQIVLACSGAVVPMDVSDFNDASELPGKIDFVIFPGRDSDFTLIEDAEHDGGSIVKTTVINRLESGGFAVLKAAGNIELITHRRDCRLTIAGIREPVNVQLTVNGVDVIKSAAYIKDSRRFVMEIDDYNPFDEYRISVNDIEIELTTEERENDIFNFLVQAQISFELKEKIMTLIQRREREFSLSAELNSLISDKNLLGVLYELLS